MGLCRNYSILPTWIAVKLWIAVEYKQSPAFCGSLSRYPNGCRALSGLWRRLQRRVPTTKRGRNSRRKMNAKREWSNWPCCGWDQFVSYFFLKWLYKVVCIFHSNFNGSIIHLDVVLYIFFSQVQRDDGNDDQLPSSEVWFVGSWQQWPSESGRNATGLWHKWDVLDADAALWHFQVRGFKRNSTLFWWTNI